MKKSVFCLLLFFVTLIFAGFPVKENLAEAKVLEKNNSEITVSSKSALLVDYASGNVIFEKNSNDRLPIASMTKLATLAIVFDAVDKGIIKLSDNVVVSQVAADVGGSSAFLDAGSSYKLSELVKSVIVASANDSSVAIAEYVSGTEDAFVQRMNKMAQGLGLKNTNFANCTGLPVDNHYSSAYDILQIYKLICDNEIYKAYSKIWMEDFIHPSGRKTGLVNTNRLVKTYDGIEGGKTGYTDSAKFCLTASAKRGGMRLMGVVIGADSSKTRFAEMSRMFDYGFANFKNEEIINSKVPVAILSLKKAKNSVEVYPERNIVKFLNKSDMTKFSTDFELYEMKAPIAKGDIVGKMFVFDESNMVVDEVNLIASGNIEAIDFGYSLKNILKHW